MMIYKESKNGGFAVCHTQPSIEGLSNLLVFSGVFLVIAAILRPARSSKKGHAAKASAGNKKGSKKQKGENVRSKAALALLAPSLMRLTGALLQRAKLSGLAKKASLISSKLEEKGAEQDQPERPLELGGVEIIYSEKIDSSEDVYSMLAN